MAKKDFEGVNGRVHSVNQFTQGRFLGMKCDSARRMRE